MGKHSVRLMLFSKVSRSNSIAIKENPIISRTNDQVLPRYCLSTSAPRMIHSYRRTSSPRPLTNVGEIFTPAHEENVRFIHDTWQYVLRDFRSLQSSEHRSRGPQEYVEKNPNPALHSFTPVDLSEVRERYSQDSRKS